MNSSPRSCRLISACEVETPRRSATRLPFGRVLRSPNQGAKPSKTWWRIAVPHAQRDVADELLVEAVAHLARGQQLAVEAGERRGVDADHHRQARLVDADHGQRARIVGVGEGLADGDVLDPRDRDDLAGA